MENLPFAFGAAVEIERVGADPVFDLIGFGERRSPLNARGIDLFVGLEIDDDPLWMERIRFAGEFASEVGIAFPIEKVGALDGTVAAGGEAPVWEGVGKHVADCARRAPRFRLNVKSRRASRTVSIENLRKRTA